MTKKILGFFLCTLFLVITIPTEGEMINTINDGIKQIKDLQMQEFVPGEFIVKISNGIEIPTPQIEELNNKYKVKSFERIFKNSENTTLNNFYIFNVKKTSNILSIINDYSLLSEVVFAEPNYIIKSDIIQTSLTESYLTFFNEFITNINDPDFSKQWALENTGQFRGNPDCDIDALEAWGIETGDPNIVISVIDTGIDYNHSDLKNNTWINEDEIPNNGIDDDCNGFIDDFRGWDFVNNDNDPIDDFGHGTACAGVAAGVPNNSKGIAGVCWNSKIMPVKSLNFLGSATVIRIARGIKYAADNDANIISMSFGGIKKSYLINYAVDYAYDKNIVLIAAAGNGNTNTNHYPAAYENVIAVSATDNKDKRMIIGILEIKAASNFGPWIDVAAPGKKIYTSMPTYFVIMNLRGYKRNYEYLSGTSMSAPYVSGLAALILSKNPDFSNEEVKSLICENVDPYNSELYLGTGRINVFKALNENIPMPLKPNKPLGPIIGVVGEKYTYMTNTNDSQGDRIYYMWDWGEETSNWIGPFDSGEVIITDHTWKKSGIYDIKVKAKNIDGAESLWSKPLGVTIPRDKVKSNFFILSFLKCFPIFQNLLSTFRNLMI
jgi:subtilisin family serine protease